MDYCKGCHRPVVSAWIECAWCGHQRSKEEKKRRSLVGFVQVAMLLEAVALMLGTVAIGVLWALSDWSMERGQTLGTLWLGALGGAALLVWLSINVGGRRTAPAVD